MTKNGFSTLLARRAEFEMMEDGQRRAAGRQAKRDAADLGYLTPCGYATLRNSDGRRSRIALFAKR